jgi:hypothetical protein
MVLVDGHFVQGMEQDKQEDRPHLLLGQPRPSGVAFVEHSTLSSRHHELRADLSRWPTLELCLHPVCCDAVLSRAGCMHCTWGADATTLLTKALYRCQLQSNVAACMHAL